MIKVWADNIYFTFSHFLHLSIQYRILGHQYLLFSSNKRVDLTFSMYFEVQKKNFRILFLKFYFYEPGQLEYKWTIIMDLISKGSGTM